MPIQPDEKPIVYVVDDDPSVRGALESLFDSVGICARTYGTAQDFLDIDNIDHPGCIVIDVRLPDMNGLEFQAMLAPLGIHLPVVVMTGHGDISMSVRAMKRGAVDFLPKPFRDQDMLDAVMAAIDRDREHRQLEGNFSDLQKRFATLSPREQQVMLLVTSGKLNKQVAWELGISEITVKVHRGGAMRKMEARTLPELVRMADLINCHRPNEGSQHRG